MLLDDASGFGATPLGLALVCHFSIVLSLVYPNHDPLSIVKTPGAVAI